MDKPSIDKIEQLIETKKKKLAAVEKDVVELMVLRTTMLVEKTTQDFQATVKGYCDDNMLQFKEIKDGIDKLAGGQDSIREDIKKLKMELGVNGYANKA